MCAALALCFASCKADKKSGGSEGEAAVSESVTKQAQATTKAANAPKAEIIPQNNEDVRITVLKNHETFTLGEGNDDGYINKSAGFKIEGLGSEWRESSPQQIANIFDSGVDPSTGKAYSSNSEDGSQNYLYDIMYTNVKTDEVMSVSLLEYSGETALDDEIPMGGTSSSIDGFTDKEELIYLNFAGKKVSCKKVNYVKTKNIAKVPDVTEYEIYMMSSSCKQVIKIVIVCFDGQPNIDDILKYFKSTE